MSHANNFKWQLSDNPLHFEKLLHANPEAFLDPEAARAGMIRAERTVARIENPEGTPVGTGFLIGPDLLITNQHVREDYPHGSEAFDQKPNAVCFRFAHRRTGMVASQSYRLHPKHWLVAFSPVSELDYCIVRLSQSAGSDSIGDDHESPKRGWLALETISLRENQALSILQHPLGGPLRLAHGHLLTTDSSRVNYHVDTEPGSSGSPVFDCSWRCVALHSSSGAGLKNVGIRAAAILGSLSVMVRDSLTPFETPIDGRDLEGIQHAGQSPPLSVDNLTHFELRALALNLLSGPLTSTRRSILVGDKSYSFFVTDVGRDSGNLMGLRGGLELWDVVEAAMQERSAAAAISPVSAIAFGVLASQDQKRKEKTIQDIQERVASGIRDLRQGSG